MMLQRDGFLGARLAGWALVGVVAMTAPGCGTGSMDEPAIEGADELDSTSSALSPRKVRPYYSVRQDFRRCVFPLCGGNWVKEVNRKLTRCVDGSFAEECYVATFDWSGVNLGADAETVQNTIEGGLGIVRGSIVARRFAGFGRMGEMVPSEAWVQGGTTEPTGTYFRARDNGIRCITFPCFTIAEQALNTGEQYTVSDLDLSGAGADDKAIAAGYDALFTPSGVIAAGANETVPNAGPAGDAVVLRASQFYTRADVP